MARAKVAVTGASGFIGAHLLPALLERGYEVHALTRRPESIEVRQSLRVISGGHDDAAALSELLEGADAVVHLAGLIKARRRAEFFEVNAGMTEALAELAVKSGAEPHFLLLSSLAAREPALGPYGASKSDAEQSLARSGLSHWSVLRPPVVYGPGDEETLRFFRAVAKGYIPYPAGRKARVSMIHVTDLVTAILAVLEKGPIEGPFELDDGAPRGHSWPELGRVAASVFGRSAKPIAVPRGLMWGVGLGNEMLGAVTGASPMITRAKVREFFHPDWVAARPGLSEEVEWMPSISLELGFEDTIASYLAENRV